MLFPCMDMVTAARARSRGGSQGDVGAQRTRENGIQGSREGARPQAVCALTLRRFLHRGLLPLGLLSPSACQLCLLL